MKAGITVDVPAAVCTPDVLNRLRFVLHSHEGYVPVRLRFISAEGFQRIKLGSDMAVDGSDELLRELFDLDLIPQHGLL